jgi:hypothetical protein
VEVDVSTVQTEITELEERLRLAELGPDPKFFEEMLDDSLVIVSEKGEPFLAKPKIVEAHQPGKAQKFTRVEMSDMKIIDHGNAAAVTCRGTFEGPQSSVTLKFLRVWLKKDDHWKIVAGSIAQ